MSDADAVETVESPTDALERARRAISQTHMQRMGIGGTEYTSPAQTSAQQAIAWALIALVEELREFRREKEVGNG